MRAQRAQFRALLQAACLGAVFAAAAPHATAQEETQGAYDIPAQSLSSALVQYSRQSGDVVVTPADLVAGKMAPAVRGNFAAGSALEQLLAGSGLAPQRRPEGGVTLVIADSVVLPTEAAIPLPEFTTFEEVVVTGAPLRDLAHAYARTVALAGPVDVYPRWNFGICPGVAGLNEEQGQALIDHIARRAYEVGVRTERSGCRPNIIIVFASDGDAVARAIVDRRRDVLGSRNGSAVFERAALEEFVAAPRPVRWWHVSRALAGPTPGTRLSRGTRHDLGFALVVVDMGRAGDAPPPALADYLAMAALARLNPRADMSRFSTILNLFAERAADEPTPAAMTVWDHAYLHGLYEGRAEVRDADRQLADIARRMAERVEREH